MKYICSAILLVSFLAQPNIYAFVRSSRTKSMDASRIAKGKKRKERMDASRIARKKWKARRKEVPTNTKHIGREGVWYASQNSAVYSPAFTTRIAAIPMIDRGTRALANNQNKKANPINPSATRIEKSELLNYPVGFIASLSNKSPYDKVFYLSLFIQRNLLAEKLSKTPKATILAIVRQQLMLIENIDATDAFIAESQFEAAVITSH